MREEASPTSTPPVSPWRLWVTGRMPHGVVVPPLAGHDTPSPPETTWGRLCLVKACRKRDPQATKSLRFQPSGSCVACWERWDKTVTTEDEEPPRAERLRPHTR